MKKFTQSLVFKLLLGIIIGIVIGLVSNETFMTIIVPIRNILSSFITYMVPLIILGFITPAIVSLKEDIGKVLGVTLLICYISSVGAAVFSMVSGYTIIPHLDIANNVGAGRKLPESPFELTIDPIFPTMTALITAILVGIATLSTKSTTWENLLKELNNIVMWIVEKIVITLLPIYIATTFATLAYEGAILHELPIFLKIIIIVIIGHYIWLALLYAIGGALSKTNPFEVLKHYLPAYVTALGTMSSAATLPVSLRQAGRAKTLGPKIRDFVIPICSNTHLCGSVLTETFFVMTVSKILYGQLPALSTMITFACLLGIFAIAAPGVPGGTVVASLGLIISVLGFDESGTALMLSIFALQDSFGTACNITGDGAIALMVTGIFKKVPGRNGNPPYEEIKDDIIE
ncbi:MAG: cation:dicarboxylase symporter family transporter [Tissierellia bacterium]|nr:cation:dicarboxylase symporter family transporter [Tissierellia bacterium]